MKNKRLVYCLLAVTLFLFITKQSWAQCDYEISVVQEKLSDCWSNGIVKATLYGPNVTNGNVQIGDAQYSIASVVPGGYNMAFSKKDRKSVV